MIPYPSFKIFHGVPTRNGPRSYGTPLLWFSLMKIASGLIVRVPVNLDHGVILMAIIF